MEEARSWIFGDAHKQKASPGSVVSLKAAAGAAAFTMTPAQLAEADAAFRTCKNLSLSLTEAIQFAARHASPAAGSISLTEALEEALKQKKKSKRPSYLVDLGKRWRRFEKWLPAEKRKAINGITKLDVRKFLNACKLKPVGERNMLRNLSVLFTWAVNQQHIAENPCHKMVVEASTTKRNAVRILSVEEARKLLHFAVKGFRVEAKESEKSLWREKFGAVSLTVPSMDLVPIIAVGCFAGIRPDESARMSWAMIDFKRKHIDLPAEITKDGNRRIVDMSDNLLQCLLVCPKKTKKLLPLNFRRKRWALSKAMGWNDGWPNDILRHSYGSYHLAKHRNASFTAEQMGHKNALMLYRHYREVIKDAEDIDEYWDIKPEPDSKILLMNAAA